MTTNNGVYFERDNVKIEEVISIDLEKCTNLYILTNIPTKYLCTYIQTIHLYINTYNDV